MKDRKPIRLIASDLDGTLYHGAQELGKMTPANRDAIIRWKDAGNRFLIATGRRACTREEIIREYAVDCDIIACNGAKVILNDQLLWSREVMPPELNELCDLCEPFRDELDFVLDIDITERITYQADSLIQKRFPEDLYLRQVRDYLNQPQTAYPNKIFMILADPARLPFFLDYFGKHFQGRLAVTSSGPDLVEMSCAGCSKGAALLEILDRLGLDRKQAAAIGDEQNDLDMLQSIPYGFAMNSARSAIKAQVPYSVDSVHDLIDACLRYNAACEQPSAANDRNFPEIFRSSHTSIY